MEMAKVKMAIDFGCEAIMDLSNYGKTNTFRKGMEMTGNENPFYEYYDKVLDILAKYDVTISLGDACRPGSTHDSTDASQITELIELGI